MRLWHQSLIKKLPRQQLLGQHRECCALRGNGWGKKHSTVDYIFKYPPEYLIAYHFLVMIEMKERGYNVNEVWLNSRYRGKKCKEYDDLCDTFIELLIDYARYEDNMIIAEHNDEYLNECIENLRAKGIKLYIFILPD